MPTERRQKLRGTTAQLNAVTGLLGLLTVDVSTMGLRVFDGVTMGGFAIPNKASNDAAYVPQARTVTGTNGVTGGGDLGSNRTLELGGQARALHDWDDTGFLFHTGSEGEYRPVLLTTGLEINDVDVGGTMTLILTPDATVVRTSGEQTITGGLTTFETQLFISGAPGGSRALRFETDDVSRWSLAADATAEGGANSGSNFMLGRYDDDGAWLGQVFSVNRATGVMHFFYPPVGDGTGLSGLAHAATTISPGDGLTGGGTLAENRTLAVDSTVLRTTGSQTVSGVKAHSATLRLNNNVALSGGMVDGISFRDLLKVDTDNNFIVGNATTPLILRSPNNTYFQVGTVIRAYFDANGSLWSTPAAGASSFVAASGAANNPAYAFASATGRGMYSTANGIGFTNGNILRGEIVNSGFKGGGSELTALNASQLTSGTVPSGRLNIATTAEAEAGTGNTQVMTPLRVKEYYDKRRDSDADHSDTTGDTTMPIGSYVLVNVTTSVNRNAVIDVRISNGGSFEFVNGAHPDAGTALAGTWRARGYRLLGGTERIAFAQRVA